MKRKKIFFETNLAAKKSQVIHAWKAGKSVSAIAKEAGTSRDTIYRWLGKTEKTLDQKKGRGEKIWSEDTLYKVRELYVLLRAPSVRELSEKMKIYYSLSLSESQLRRLLQRLQIYEWKPSLQFDFIQKMEAAVLKPSKTSGDSVSESESLRKSPGRSSGRVSSGLPFEERGGCEEGSESLSH